MSGNTRKILVTGATGQQGGAVARHLLAEGWPVHALVRDAGRPAATALKDAGAELVVGDLDDASSLRAALTGVYGVFSVQTPWIFNVDTIAVDIIGEERQGKALATAAKDARVAHFVYTSVGSADRDTKVQHFESKWRIEQHIRALGLPATVLRPVFCMDNFAGPFSGVTIDDGTLVIRHLLHPDTSLQMIAVDDIGALAALAFDRPDDFIGRTIEIAGDELTGPQLADVFAAVTEYPATFVEQPIDEIRAVNEDMAEIGEFFNRDGYQADIDAIRQLRPELKTLETWLRETAWTPSTPAR